MYIGDWNSPLLPHTPTLKAEHTFCACVCAAACECRYVSLWVWESVWVKCNHHPAPATIRAIKGPSGKHACACACVRTTAATDPSVKSPGVPVKVLIRLVQIKRGWQSPGSRGGGAIPLGHQFQILLLVHQLGWINHSLDSFDWFPWTAWRPNKGTMQISVEERSRCDTVGQVYRLVGGLNLYKVRLFL